MEPHKISVGSCFSGIGGLELGLEWTGGFETKWQIEMDEYASKVLAKHWPDVKRYRDIRDVVRPELVELICGGFPCQDVSVAGARKGLEGKRSTLWSEMFRIICEVKPKWVVAENVPGLLSSDNGQFFGNILRDLAGAGYDAEWGVLSAAGVGAPHIRKRIFIVANASPKPKLQADPVVFPIGKVRRTRVSDPGVYWPEMASPGWEIYPPWVIGSIDGLPGRMERCLCLGNAVVPQVAEKIGRMILQTYCEVMEVKRK